MGNRTSDFHKSLEDITSLVCAPAHYQDDSYALNDSTGHVHPFNPNNTSDFIPSFNINSIQYNISYDYITNETVSSYEQLCHFLYTKVAVYVCAFGLIGNIFNLAILTPKVLHCSLGRMEKFVYSGLIGLALSDMMFCILILPRGFMNIHEDVFDRITFKLVYETYGDALINMTVLCSTWLTVALALGRYLAVCHPLRAREVIGMTFAKRSLCCVVISCVLFNLPKFWEFTIARVECEGLVMYFRLHDYMKMNQTASLVYTWAYFIIGILLPFILLMFCNWFLVRALGRSRLSESMMSATSHKHTMDARNNLTLVLILIVIMYIVLVSPAELLNCLRHRYMSNTLTLNLAVAIVNTLQALNFSVNFTVYCAINVSFRRSVVNMLKCRCKRIYATEKRSSVSRYITTTNEKTRFGVRNN